MQQSSLRQVKPRLIQMPEIFCDDMFCGFAFGWRLTLSVIKLLGIVSYEIVRGEIVSHENNTKQKHRTKLVFVRLVRIVS